jgi:phosphoribosyl 1,2-cyclic phosphodiesterase
MQLKVIGSGSSGNCYLVFNENETLILDCGLRFETIKRGLNFNLSNVVGCLVTHSHGDHAKGVKDAVNAGIDIYCLKETADTFGFYNHRINYIQPEKQFKIGGFTIIPVSMQHDVPCVGFYIKHAETGNFVYITDTLLCEYVFPDLNNIIVEANYCQQILDARLQAGSSMQFLRDRVIQSHMSIQTCKQFLAANDLKKVNNILLIHLSDNNSHAERFKREVRAQTTKRVHIAEAGYTMDFNIKPF